jgi:citrate lyase subunit beta / citryl-CoA lyase
LTLDPVAAARSFLFAPGDDPRKLASANRSGADAIVADLEDAVAPERKGEARAVVAAFARERGAGPPLLVRVNGLTSPFATDDLRGLDGLPLSGVVLPKSRIGDLHRAVLPRLPLVAMIEDARGLLDAVAVAADERVTRLALGAVDLAAELGLRAYRDGLELVHARSSLVVASAAAGIAPPVDTPFLQYDDAEGLRAECLLARSIGFAGKACIHPAQLRTVAEAFAPSPDELAWAAEIVQAFEHAAGARSGVTSHRGLMVDAPVVARARLLLEQAERKETS